MTTTISFAVPSLPNIPKSLSPTRAFRLAALCLFLFFYSSISAQDEPDFLKQLNDSAATMGITDLQRPGKYLPFSGNELINLRRLEASTRKGNSKGVFFSSANLGMIYLKKGDPAKASVYFKKATDAARAANNNNYLTTALIESALAQIQLKNFTEALQLLQDAAPLAESQKLPKVIGLVQALCAQCFNKLHDSNSAAEYYKRASKSYLSANEKDAAALCLNNLGEMQLKLNDSKKAQENFLAALDLFNQGKNTKLKAVVLRNMGLVQFKKGLFENAIDFFNKSFSYDRQLLVKKLLKDSYMQLFTLYSFNNDFAKADIYHDKYRSLKDSLTKVEGIHPTLSGSELEQKQQIIDMLQKQNQEQSNLMNQTQLELSQVISKTDIEIQAKDRAIEEQEIALEALNRVKAEQERDLAKKEVQLERQTGFRNLLLALTLAAIILAFLLYNRYMIKRKSNTQLEQSNKELADTLLKLKSAQNQLVQTEKMASLGQLTAGIAHEIQNPLNFVNNFSETAIELIEEMKNSEDPAEKAELERDIVQLLSKINHHGKRADDIVKNMLLHSRSGDSKKEPVDINKLCEEIAGLAYHGARVKMPSLNCKLTTNYVEHIPELTINRQEVGRVLLNIISNGFYAMNKKKQALSDNNYQPQLLVSTAIKNDFVEIIVKDNGTGVPKSVLDKIFEPFFTTKPAGEGTGLGLSLSFDIINKGHGGQLTADSKEGEYTLFSILLPLKA